MPISLQRRNLLKQLPVLTTGTLSFPLVARTFTTQSTARWGMLIDLRRCFSCQACTVACHYENQLPDSCHRTRVHTRTVKIGADKLYVVSLPQLCNHCGNPICTSACPVGATYSLPEGNVVIDSQKCIGCGICVRLCPYDARFINPKTKKADKCTFCINRVSQGLLPACVETCAGGARIFGDLNDPESLINKELQQARNQDQKVHVLMPEKNTQPNVFYIGLDEAAFEQGVDRLHY